MKRARAPWDWRKKSALFVFFFALVNALAHALRLSAGGVWATGFFGIPLLVYLLLDLGTMALAVASWRRTN